MVAGEDLKREEENCSQGGEDAEGKEGHKTGAVLEQIADSEQQVKEVQAENPAAGKAHSECSTEHCGCASLERVEHAHALRPWA